MRDELNNISWKSRTSMLSLLVLIVAAFVVYGRILGHEFLSNWDDNRYILENPDVHGISWPRIMAVFSKYYVGNYAPVHMLSYMLDYAVWGLWAGGYLLTNLVLHVINTFLLYRLLLRLIGVRLAAWCGAALFLLHPVQVESIAWISQRKNLLAMLFFLLAWELYLNYRECLSARKRFYYAASLVALLLALLSKSVAVIFPVVIVLFDHCYPSETGRSRYVDKVPFILVAVAAAVLALLSQAPDYTELTAGGGRAAYYGGSAFATFLTMLPVYCSYLRMIVWPVSLSALYAPDIHKSIDFTVLSALFFLGTLLFLVYRSYRHDRSLAFWPLLAVISLLPVSQIVPLVTLMNDRYLYFPMLGVAGLMAYAIRVVIPRVWRGTYSVATSVAILLMLLAAVSFQRVSVWRNAQALWSDTVKKTPGNSIAWEALGESLHYTARPNRIAAISAYRRAIELNPNGDISRYNLGVAYIDLNDFDNAEKILGELLQRSPNNVMGWTAFGDLALRRSRLADAEYNYRKALALQPEAVQIHQKIGNLMVVLGRIDEARSAYVQIEAIQGGNDPVNAYELARIESIAGDSGASIRWLEAALQRGYNDFSGIINDEELTPVLADGRFGELVNKYFPKQKR
jgi:tetratricopeptide (TPR) repeat protein